MPEVSLFAYIVSHPLVWLGSGLFMIASLIALSGRLNRRDSALIYTFVISVLIVLMGVASAMSRMQQDKMLATQPAAAEIAPAKQP